MVQNGKQVSGASSAAPPKINTIVKVSRLFSSIPIRRTLLTKPQELNTIAEFLRMVSIIKFRCSIALIDEDAGRVVESLHRTTGASDSLARVIGRSNVTAMTTVEVFSRIPPVRVAGCAGMLQKTMDCPASLPLQVFFVNGNWAPKQTRLVRHVTKQYDNWVAKHAPDASIHMRNGVPLSPEGTPLPGNQLSWVIHIVFDSENDFEIANWDEKDTLYVEDWNLLNRLLSKYVVAWCHDKFRLRPSSTTTLHSIDRSSEREAPTQVALAPAASHSTAANQASPEIRLPTSHSAASPTLSPLHQFSFVPVSESPMTRCMTYDSLTFAASLPEEEHPRRKRRRVEVQSTSATAAVGDAPPSFEEAFGSTQSEPQQKETPTRPAGPTENVSSLIGTWKKEIEGSREHLPSKISLKTATAPSSASTVQASAHSPDAVSLSKHDLHSLRVSCRLYERYASCCSWTGLFVRSWGKLTTSSSLRWSLHQGFSCASTSTLQTNEVA